jgi:pimeloyl-ACP methyl ester carboxylesterase
VTSDALSAKLSATPSDLPRAVADALVRPSEGRRGEVEASGITWGTIEWGDPSDPPVLLIHGVTSNAGIWWRIGPALAASGRRVIAVDMPGHGPGTLWRGRHRFAETADEVAGFITAAGLDRRDLAIVGHSWGAMVTAHLPLAGIRPAVIVLIDPPCLDLAGLAAITRQATERPHDTIEEARDVVRAENPTWNEGDVEAKARALTQFNAECVLAVLSRNGAWDAGMAALRDSTAAAIPTWLIRGEWATGGLIPDAEVPAFEAQLGAGHVITIAGGPHSPQRTHPEATVLAILRALET